MVLFGELPKRKLQLIVSMTERIHSKTYVLYHQRMDHGSTSCTSQIINLTQKVHKRFLKTKLNNVLMVYDSIVYDWDHLNDPMIFKYF